MQRNAVSLTDRLHALMAPIPKLDRFDELALDIMADASGKPFREARESIAARLRALASEAAR